MSNRFYSSAILSCLICSILNDDEALQENIKKRGRECCLRKRLYMTYFFAVKFLNDVKNCFRFSKMMIMRNKKKKHHIYYNSCILKMMQM